MAYQGLGHRLRTYAAIPLIALAAGCGGGEPAKPTPEAQKPAVSQPLEKKVVEAPKPDERGLMEWYREFVEVNTNYQKTIDEAVAEFAKRSGIKLEEVTPEDYNAVARPFTQEMRKDPKARRILNLSSGNITTLSELLSQNLDMNKVRRAKGDLYLQSKDGVRAFYDPELTLPASVSDYLGLLVNVTNPRVYRTSTGIEAVDLGKGYWARLSDFGPKPGEHARRLYQGDLKRYQESLTALKDVLKKIKPGMTSEQVTKVLSESNLGEGLGSLEDIKSYIAQRETESQRLQKVLALK